MATSYSAELQTVIAEIVAGHDRPLSPEYIVREARSTFHAKYGRWVRGSSIERCTRWMANELGTIKSTKKRRHIFYTRTMRRAN